MEIETAVDKPAKTVTMGGDAGRKGTEGPTVLEEKRSGEVAALGGKTGPRFKALGGMKGVTEELMMEVIMPLCHQQLPRWLGVRPMAGILLHGLPGCGKTKLAHAIANKTGVPFYKISATEVVSGVSGEFGTVIVHAEARPIEDSVETPVSTAKVVPTWPC